MSIIVKFTLRNIKEKKLRTFLIVFSIMISSALFFASMALSTTTEKMVLEEMKRYFGTADIMVSPGRNSSGFLSPSLLDDYKDRVEYVVGMVWGSGEYKHEKETRQLNMLGYDLDDLQIMNPIILSEQKNLRPFTGKKIIIDKTTAEQYQLKLGDRMDINMNNSIKRFRIVGISQPVGPFQGNNERTHVVVPGDLLAGMDGHRGKVSELYIKVKDPAEQETMIEELQKAYPRYRVDYTIQKAELKKETKQMSIPFLIMVVFVMIMSIFIIYTSFKVITTERLPIIGTFRSMGATKKMTDTVLIVESIIYGIIGGAIGDIAGIGILRVIMGFVLPPWMQDMKNMTQYTPGQLIGGFVLAVLLSFLSSFIPIVKVSKIPVKDIVLNKIEKVHKKRTWKRTVGILFLVFALLGPHIAPEKVAIIIDGIGMFLIIPAVVLLVPELTSGFVKLFEWVYERVFGNEAKLAAHNLKGNKSILNNITLLAIGISTLFMINTLSSSIAKDTLDYYKDFKYDIQLWVWPMDRETESKLVSMEGIEGTYGQYRAWGVEVVNKEEKVSINGVDPDKHLDYMNISMKGDPKKALKELNSGRNILLNELEKEKLQIEKGDILTLKTQKGILPYKVIGFFQSKSQKALVANRYLRSDMQLTRYDRIGIKTNQDAEEVVKAIQEKFKRKNPYVRTIEQSRKENMEGNKRIFAIFQGFSIMALVIGVFGVINNFIIGFMERRQALAIFRSVGMNKKQMIKMIFIEAFTGGLIGSLIGIFGGALLVSIIPKLLEPLGGHLEMYVSIPSLFVCVLMGSMITIIASISPALKSSKLNIIEAIKYE